MSPVALPSYGSELPLHRTDTQAKQFSQHWHRTMNSSKQRNSAISYCSKQYQRVRWWRTILDPGCDSGHVSLMGISTVPFVNSFAKRLFLLFRRETASFKPIPSLMWTSLARLLYIIGKLIKSGFTCFKRYIIWRCV